MRHIDTLIIGAGQAGLAMSRCLSERLIDHVVVERGRIAERWRTERWDSLRLLTPNWMSRLPGFRYEGPDPDGFMSMPELVRFFERYAASCAAPVHDDTRVTVVERSGRRFRVQTTRGAWLADNVVIATGYSDVPSVPSAAARLTPRAVQVVPTVYRNPGQLPPGGVLVVGASATGIQIAAEVHASGRPVTLAAGAHQRMPRTYRGRDVLWWLDAMGILRDPVDGVFDIRASRRQPSLQLVGRSDVQRLDISVLRQQGVRVLGRLEAVDGERALFDDDLIATSVASDIKLAQTLTRIDEFIRRTGNDGRVPDAEPFAPTWPAAFDLTRTTVDLQAAGIHTVIWATGFRRRYPWLRVPVLDEAGEIRQRGGVTPVAGLYVLGMHFQRRRHSAFIDGVGEDARVLAGHIAARFDGAPGAAAFTPREATIWTDGLSI